MDGLGHLVVCLAHIMIYAHGLQDQMILRHLTAPGICSGQPKNRVEWLESMRIMVDLVRIIQPSRIVLFPKSSLDFWSPKIHSFNPDLGSWFQSSDYLKYEH